MDALIKSIFAVATLFFAGSAMGTIIYTPADCNAGVNCWTIDADPPAVPPNQPSLAEFAALVGVSVTDVEFLYKSNYGGGDSESFAGRYSTAFAGDPNKATITWDGSDYISCEACYLWAKDGNTKPYLYVFNIGGWDGQGTLTLDKFWMGKKGAISNVGIFGRLGDVLPPPVQVPEPGTLLGLGLIGAAWTRRRKTNA